jgi:hypothetical protein
MNVVQFKAKSEELFDEFWSVYPKRMAKAHARIAFDRACKKADAKTIIEAAKQFSEFLQHQGTQKKYMPLATTWLNGERWEDELYFEDEQSDWGDMNEF